MKKDIYDMINDSDIDLDEYEKCELTDIEKAKMKKFARKNNKKNGNKFSKLAKVSVFGVLFGGGFLLSPFGEVAFAGIELATYHIADFMGIEKDLDGYKTVVDKTVTDNGVSVKLNEVILDGDMLKVVMTGYIEDSEKKYDSLSFNNERVYINGKMAGGGMSGGYGKTENNTFKYDYDFTIENLEEYDLTKDLDIKIKLDNARTTIEDGPKAEVGKKRSGDWDFEFTISPKELIADTEVIDINKRIDVDGIGFVDIEKYTSNKVGQKIYIKCSDELLGEYSEQINGTDNLGNKVEFDIRHNGPDGGVLELYTLEGELSEEATELTLRLELVKYPETSGEMSSDYKQYGEEFTIKIK